VEDRQARTRVPRGGGGRKTTRARLTRGVKDRKYLSVSMRGGGDLGQYIFWKSADSSSLSEKVITLTEGITAGCFV